MLKYLLLLFIMTTLPLPVRDRPVTHQELTAGAWLMRWEAGESYCVFLPNGEYESYLSYDENRDHELEQSRTAMGYWSMVGDRLTVHETSLGVDGSEFVWEVKLHGDPEHGLHGNVIIKGGLTSTCYRFALERYKP